jgi:hypothetical protein
LRDHAVRKGSFATIGDYGGGANAALFKRKGLLATG